MIGIFKKYNCWKLMAYIVSLTNFIINTKCKLLKFSLIVDHDCKNYKSIIIINDISQTLWYYNNH